MVLYLVVVFLYVLFVVVVVGWLVDVSSCMAVLHTVCLISIVCWFVVLWFSVTKDSGIFWWTEDTIITKERAKSGVMAYAHMHARSAGGVVASYVFHIFNLTHHDKRRSWLPRRQPATLQQVLPLATFWHPYLSYTTTDQKRITSLLTHDTTASHIIFFIYLRSLVELLSSYIR